MDWPPQSSDVNITEAVWDYLDRQQNSRNIPRRTLSVPQETWRNYRKASQEISECVEE